MQLVSIYVLLEGNSVRTRILHFRTCAVQAAILCRSTDIFYRQGRQTLYGALVVTPAMLMSLINCCFIIIIFFLLTNYTAY